MQKLTILNTREVKKIKELLQKEFAYSLKVDHAYLRNEKGKVFLVNKDIARIDLKKLIIDKVGLYFAEIKGDQVRLSKEGAQLLAREAQENKQQLKNIVDLNENEVKTYFSGENLEKDLGPENRLVLLRCKEDVLGCARYKAGKIINFLSKTYRGEII